MGDQSMKQLGRWSRRSFLGSILPAAAALELNSSAIAQKTDSGMDDSRIEARERAASRATWMTQARWGVMTHYLADWIPGQTGKEMTVERWNDLIDHFDVEGLADQLKAAGVPYHLISIGQNSGYYLSPNATYDRIVGIRPSKCSKRDLIADLYAAYHRRGVKLMVYLPSGAPDKDPVAVKALEWKKGPYRNSEFQIKWQEIIREWSERWGTKVSGWWFDGAYWPNTMYRTPAPNFSTFAAAARAGNPESALAFNPGVFHNVPSITPFEDYTAGEIDRVDQISFQNPQNGILDGTQIHVLSHLGEEWGMGAPRYSTDQVVAFTRKMVDKGGVFTWDTPVQLNGHIAQPFIEQWSALGRIK
jgi:hypothetical protein